MDEIKKIEKNPIWFTDIPDMERTLSRNSQEGWHIQKIDPVKGLFHYQKGKPQNRQYILQRMGHLENLVILADSSYKKILESDGLSLWGKDDFAPEELEEVTQQFDKHSATEESWLHDKAMEGLHLVRVRRPAYTFRYDDAKDLQYHVEYHEGIKGPAEYMKKLQAAQWNYIWGDAGYHYFCAPADTPVPSLFRMGTVKTAIYKNRSTAFLTAGGIALFFALGALVLLIINWVRYAGATESADLSRFSGGIVSSLIALIVCILLIIGSAFGYFIMRQKAGASEGGLFKKLQTAHQQHANRKQISKYRRK